MFIVTFVEDILGMLNFLGEGGSTVSDICSTYVLGCIPHVICSVI